MDTSRVNVRLGPPWIILTDSEAARFAANFQYLSHLPNFRRRRYSRYRRGAAIVFISASWPTSLRNFQFSLASPYKHERTNERTNDAVAFVSA
ncbi:hypothetical protein V9T40_010513 [Parthenolecanium corni]|uniref:Uncharacterized protein n=1 Tax=Parthenolecanium corni TaxID=536013 RepID=A0AAN9TGV4_9HEMI